MNCVEVSGRLTRNPEIFNHKKKTIAKFTLAVQRDYSTQKDVDYLTVTSFDKLAEFCDKYLCKGIKIMVIGCLRTSNYVKNGITVYVTEIHASRIEFCEKLEVNQEKALANKSEAESKKNKTKEQIAAEEYAEVTPFQ